MSKRNSGNGDLVMDFMFCWSLDDIFNGDLFKGKVSLSRQFPSQMY